MAARKKKNEAEPQEIAEAVEPVAVEEKAETVEPVAEAKSEKPAKGYRVCVRKSVRCKRGIVSEGQSIEPADCINGQKDIDRLVEIGCVEKH